MLASALGHHCDQQDFKKLDILLKMTLRPFYTGAYDANFSRRWRGGEVKLITSLLLLLFLLLFTASIAV